MKQNPIVSSRLQLGRPMSSWFSSSLLNQARGLIGQRQLPPPQSSFQIQPPPPDDEEESEYEEIEHLHSYTNMNSNTNSRRSSGPQGHDACALCGNPNPLVRCEMCNNQIFCGACNDMFHRHPKRHSHHRKLLESIDNRPPLPPKIHPHQVEAPLMPVPPPRRNKTFGFRSTNASPTSILNRFPFDTMGSLKRFVGVGGNTGQRPLPMPPHQKTEQFPLTGQNRINPALSSTKHFGTRQTHEVHPTIDRRQSAPFSPVSLRNVHCQRSGSIGNPVGFSPNVNRRDGSDVQASIPLTVMELGKKRHQPQQSTSKLPEKYCLPPSRDSGWDEEEEEFLPRNQRAFSVSACNLQRFPTTTSDASHFATLQRRGSTKPPARPPPPVPPRDFSQLQTRHMYPATSAFDLSRAGAFVPWVHPTHQFQNQDLFIPYPDAIPRAPSSVGLTCHNQSPFPWSESQFDQPITSSDINLHNFERRSSEPQQPSYGNQDVHRHLQQKKSFKGNSRVTQEVDISHSPLIQRPLTPQRNAPRIPLPPPPPLPHAPSKIESEYYSGSDGEDDDDFVDPKTVPDLENLSENPQGPWSCEHCTFINSKSTRVCIVCCKTPIEGYQPIPTKQTNALPIGKKQGAVVACPRTNEINNKYIDQKLTPVVQSKLSFSNSKTQPSQKINVSTEKLEKSTGNTIKTSMTYEAEGESESEESDSSSEELITEKHRHVSNESKNNTLKNGSKIESKGRENTLRASTKTVSASTTTDNHSLTEKQNQMVDIGTGEYGIIDSDVMSENKKIQNKEKSNKKPIQNISSFKTNETESLKSSIGTSPPPQTISTQTYEELPIPKKLHQKSISKTSIQSSLIQSRESSPPRIIDMSEKALRYARRAQQQSQLKRSMSTHLTSSGISTLNDHPWAESSSRQYQHEGRHLYRSTSRQSLASDTRSLPISGPPSRDTSPPPSSSSRGRFYDELRLSERPSMDRFPSPADYFASIEDLVARKRRESMKSQEFELSRLVKEAEELNYTPEDLQVGLRMCGGDRNPVKWLQENWFNMIETVQMLATKYGRDKGQEFNEVGTISSPEAKDALRLHKGNVWAAVTECVEQRRKKFLELQSRGTFLREDILTALTANQGNLNAAYVELSKAQLKPFLMRIWGPPSGKDNESIPPRPQSPPDKVLPLQQQLLTHVLQNSPPSSIKTSSVIQNTEEMVTVKETVTQEPSSMTLETKNELILPEVDKVNLLLNHTSTELTRNDTEDETFYDLDPVMQSQSNSDDGEMDIDESEAHVSSFIQNFEIPALPPTSSLPEKLISSSDKNTDLVVEDKEEITKNQDELNVSPGLCLNEMQEMFMEGQSSSTSPEAIMTLTKAVNEIATKLSVLLQHQQNLIPSITTTKSETQNSFTTLSLNEKVENEIEKVEGGEVVFEVGESNQSENPPPSQPTESTNSVLIMETKDETLEDIYKKQLLELSKLPVLKTNVFEDEAKESHERENKETFLTSEAQAQVKDEGNEILSPLETTLRTTSNKIYEVLGIAGSFLYGGGGGGSKSKISNIKSEENVYETVGVTNGTMELIHQNEILASILEEKINLTSKLKYNLENIDIDRNESKLEGHEYGIGDDDDVFMSSLTHGSEDEEKRIENKDTIQEIRNRRIDFDNYSIESEDEEYIIKENINTMEYISGDEDHELYSDDIEMIDDQQENSIRSKVLNLSDGFDFGEENSILKRKDRDVSHLITSGRVDSIDKAQLVFNLMDMNFTEDDSIHAANECSSLYSAISFLQQECLLCAGKFSAKQMVSMLRCKHSCCRTCASEYFTVQIRDHSIIDATCPFCKEPTNLNEESDLQPSDYFSHLDILLKDLLNEHFYEMFGRKLRDWTLAKTPNFKWCSKCSSGFIMEPLQTHLVCPDCNAVTCAICLEPWDKFNHEHRDRTRSQVFCDEATSSEMLPKPIIEYLNENSVECPRCHLKFSLARGGCMHLTCSQCRYEFCSGCSAPFSMGLRCKENSPFCAKLGLHAHHPRNCLFYLRDKEPTLLIKLLKNFKIKFIENIEISKGNESQLLQEIFTKCKVSLQKETPEGLLDDFCGQDVLKQDFDVCQVHYVEYLGLLVWENHLDPIPILTNDDLETIIKRAYKKMPPKSYGTTEADYRPLLLKVIAEQIPL